MVSLNLDPESPANLHADGADELGGNTDQPDDGRDESGHLPAPGDTQADKAAAKKSTGKAGK